MRGRGTDLKRSLREDEMKQLITYRGKIVFDPEDRSNKHKKQGSWKKIAMVFIKGEICQYYGWFLKRRFNLILQPPMRGAHVSFINDRWADFDGKNEAEKLALWKEVKKKWDGKYINITVDVSDLKTMSDGEHWWFILDQDHRGQLHDIRAELGLGRPYYGLHMTIGKAVDTKPAIDNEHTTDRNNARRAMSMNLEHSRWIYSSIKKKFIKN